jgi:hypothetical protein
LGIAFAFGLSNILIPILPIFAYWGYSTFYFALNYNKMYVQTLIQKGFTPATETDEHILISKGYLASSFN